MPVAMSCAASGPEPASGAASVGVAAPPPDALEKSFRALAHGTRIQVLLLLRDSPAGLCAGEIATALPCSWPTASRHLRILEEAHFVEVRVQGRERIYAACRPHLRRHLEEWFARIFGSEFPERTPL
jgi:DNA-binding transcriptional ArsR family regulator